jgi:hypothetical protein
MSVTIRKFSGEWWSDGLGHRLIKAHPESERSEFDAGEEVFGCFIVSRGHGAVIFDFVEEALDQVSVSVKIRTESRYVFAVRMGLMLAHAPRSSRL